MQDLNSLRIDKSLKDKSRRSSTGRRVIIVGVVLLIVAAVAWFALGRMNAAQEVEVVRVTAANSAAGQSANAGDVILNATGYIVAHHKIQVASKVVGRVAWIGVEKGDRVKEGQVLVRLEDAEYRAQLQQAKGQLVTLEARLTELLNGSRPQEVDVAQANLETVKADLENARINLVRTEKLLKDGVLSQQAYDDAKARYDAQVARAASLEKTHDLVRIGPRKEVIEQAKGDIERVKGQVAYYETQLANTVIRAPITGTILERAVEKGEFVTTGFVGDRGAKGYVVTMADLNDLQVELDISQNDFAKLSPRQKAIIRTDAYRDKSYQGYIEEISPEANRQKATVQVKVKIQTPDELLRPDMNASVDFVSEAKTEAANSNSTESGKVLYVPASAVRENTVFVYLEGKAVRKKIKTGGSTPQGIRVDEGLIAGESIIANPPVGLKDGDRVKSK